MHSVQNYYSELIQQLGKTIFSIQNENPALLARYSVFFLPSASFLILSILLLMTPNLSVIFCP